MPTSFKRLFGSLILVALAFSFALPSGAAPGATSPQSGKPTDGTSPRARVDQAYAVVQLKGEPLATHAATRPAPGRKIDFNSSTVKSYRAQLAAERNNFKAWLRANAPKARVTGEFDLSVNAVSVKLNGESLGTLAGSGLVLRAEYQSLYYPAEHEDPDLRIISAAQAWAEADGPAANAGEGVKVAIIDTGIDITHPCFSGAGYDHQEALSGDPRFTNKKVIVAKVFNNKAGNRGYTPEDFDGHGTHVAGTVACNYHTPAVVDGVKTYDVSGVAPRALLGNYNVFPSDVASVRWEDLVNALEAAYIDGFHVANMSIGGGQPGIQDLGTMAVDNLDAAGMVIAVAAGNSGPGGFTMESPGAAARALTAGASTVPHFVGSPVSAGGQTYGAAAGDFETVKEDLTAPLGVVTDNTSDGVNGLSKACSALPANSLTGQIALVSRGTCAFSIKIRNAQAAGAVAVLVVNNVAGDPSAMGTDGTANQPTVPAYMVGLESGQELKDAGGLATTISKNLAYFGNTGNVDIMAGFSSRGPTDTDFRVKPDVVAPGVNVLSAQPASACAPAQRPCWAFYQGTSMATPHLAGSAAVVLHQHPTWSAAQVRSAIVNTADRGVLKAHTDGKTIVEDVNIQGAGRENLAKAVGATVALDPVSVSFGAVPSGAGQTKTFDVTLTNISGAAATYALSITGQGDKGVSYEVNQPSVSLAPGASATVTITMAAAKGATAGGQQAWLTISNGAEVAHAAVYTFIK